MPFLPRLAPLENKQGRRSEMPLVFCPVRQPDCRSDATASHGGVGALSSFRRRPWLLQGPSATKPGGAPPPCVPFRRSASPTARRSGLLAPAGLTPCKFHSESTGRFPSSPIRSSSRLLSRSLHHVSHRLFVWFHSRFLRTDILASTRRTK